jgi:hypothetical protein
MADLFVYLPRNVEADDKVDRLDIVYVQSATEDRRNLEAIHLASVRNDASALGTQGQTGQQILILAIGCSKLCLQRISAVSWACQAALQRVEQPDAVVRSEEHITKRRRECRDFIPDADPAPRLQAA